MDQIVGGIAAQNGHEVSPRARVPVGRGDLHVCGRLEVLRYLHDHGCPWAHQTRQMAIDCGQSEVLEYLDQHSVP